jgi:hypothetical protein
LRDVYPVEVFRAQDLEADAATHVVMSRSPLITEVAVRSARS